MESSIKESRILLATLYYANNEFHKAKQCLYGLLDEVGEDYSVLAILDSFPESSQRKQLLKNTNSLSNDNLIMIEAPFRRGGKKISPNETCPCGSGKKYKFVVERDKFLAGM